MRSRRSGFTLLEMLLVVLIGGVILTMGTRQYSGISNRRAVINAANAMVLTANRARSEAMRSGRLVYLQVRPDSGLARVALRTDAAVVPAFTLWDSELGKYRVRFDPALELARSGDADHQGA